MQTVSHMPTPSARSVTSQVLGVARTTHGVSISVRPLKGTPCDIDIAALPDAAGADVLTSTAGRVLSIQLCHSDHDTIQGYAFVVTPEGARKREVSPGVALALCERGVGATWVEHRSLTPMPSSTATLDHAAFSGHTDSGGPHGSR